MEHDPISGKEIMNLDFRLVFKLVLLTGVLLIQMFTDQTAFCGIRKPNVIFIVADDLGYETLGVNGGTSYKTPNLDRLAMSGVRFTQCYATPACTPSRVQVMSGQYPFRNGWMDGIWAKPREQQVVDPSVAILARIFKDAGYATAVAGKWQLARFDDNPNHPYQLGFDEYCLWTWRFGKGLPPRYWNPLIWQDGKLKEELFKNDVFGPNVFTDFLIDFIVRHKEVPFFVYYPMVLPHPPYVMTPDNLDPSGTSDKQKRFSHMVAYMDKLIGRIIDTVDRLGLREKTLILFTGDNGTPQDIISSMGIINVRGGKDLMTDAGTHVPLIANWKGITPEGVSCNDLIDFTDILPTFIQVAGLETPGGLKLDGRSFHKQLMGKKGTPRNWVFIQYGQKQAVRIKNWKLHNNGRLFDIYNDPFENEPIVKNADTKKSAVVRKDLELIFEQILSQ